MNTFNISQSFKNPTSLISIIGINLKATFYVILLLLFNFNTHAQDTMSIESASLMDEQEEIFENEKINIFRSTQIINVQTTEILPTNGIEFNIKHRFGFIQPDKTIITQFFGFDLPTNIRLGIAIPISERCYIGVGRTKYNKTYDLEGKYVFLRQDNSTPIAMAAYFNTAIRTEKFPDISNNAFFSDSITPFQYKFSHRVSYNTQLIIARKFGEKLSLQLAPVFIYNNLAVPGKKNYIVAVPFSSAIQIGLSSSILFEYSYFFNNQPENHIYPLSIGYEVGTAGHIFQIILSSSQHILEQNLYSNESGDYLEGNFLLGFNIKRIFHRKNK